MTSERSDESLRPDLTLGGLLDWRAAFLVGLATAILASSWPPCRRHH